jgi:hypothetical protein
MVPPVGKEGLERLRIVAMMGTRAASAGTRPRIS